MSEFFDTIADVGSEEEEEDEDFDGEAGEGGEPRPKKTNGTADIDDSSEEEDEDDEDILRKASFTKANRASGNTDRCIGRRGFHR